MLGGSSNPRRDWARIAEAHSEVVPKTYNYRFPGKGQRETPVAKTKEDVFYILGLLPGAVGRKYREEAARLFVSYLENPEQLAVEVADRLTPEESARLEVRLKGKRTRHVFGDRLKEHGVEGYGYARCTNAIYEPVLGANAKTLKEGIAEAKNLPAKRVNIRDHLDIQDLSDVDTAERIAAGQLKAHNAYGNKEVEATVRKSAEFTRDLLDGKFKIPGI